jgi:hypothetical protein
MLQALAVALPEEWVPLVETDSFKDSVSIKESPVENGQARIAGPNNFSVQPDA